METNSCYLDYCQQLGSKKVHVRMAFARNELLYDIENYAYIEGHAQGDGKKPHAKHSFMDVGQEGNADRVTRLLGTLHAAVVEMLLPYTATAAREEDTGNRLEEQREYVVEMDVPEDFPRQTVQLLSRLVHEYMVYHVLHDWAGMTFPELAGKWLEKAERAERGILRAKNHRTGTSRRKCSPF